MVHDLVLVQVKKPDELKYPWDYYQIPGISPAIRHLGRPTRPVRWSS